MFTRWRCVPAIIAAVFLAGVTAVSTAAAQSEKTTGVVSPTPQAEKAER